jgi:hypothetical protein
MVNLRNGIRNRARRKSPLSVVIALLFFLMTAALFFGCQKSEAPPAANAPQKAVATTPPTDASLPDTPELNYEKAMTKQYADGAPIQVTGKIMQVVDENSILVATRKDDVFGYLDNIVTIAFPQKPALGVGDIVQAKTKSAGIKKYMTEGKGEYDAPFFRGETFTVLEKGKPAK